MTTEVGRNELGKSIKQEAVIKYKQKQAHNDINRKGSKSIPLAN